MTHRAKEAARQGRETQQKQHESAAITGSDSNDSGHGQSWWLRRQEQLIQEKHARAAAGMQEPLAEHLPCSNGASTSHALSG